MTSQITLLRRSRQKKKKKKRYVEVAVDVQSYHMQTKATVAIMMLYIHDTMYIPY